MAFEHKPGSFSLFKNEKKEKDTHPDYRGTGKDLEGNEIEVAAWLKTGAKGKFMSCTFKVKRDFVSADKAREKAQEAAQAQREARKGFDDMADDLPF